MNFEYHSDLFDKIDNVIVRCTNDLAFAQKNVEEVVEFRASRQYWYLFILTSSISINQEH